MLLTTSLEFIVVVNINKLVCKVYIVSKQTQIIGYKSITLIIKPLQRIYLDL